MEGLLRYYIITSFVAVLGFVGCSSSDHGNDTHGLMAKIRNSNDSVEYTTPDNELLDDIKKVQAELPESELKFFVPIRSSEIKSFPCSNCHNKPLPQLVTERKKNEKKAHWEVELHHADLETMNCATCHDDPAKDQLVLLGGKEISFDHSYKQCGQCHSTQMKDWIGGAHGKRLGGWKPPRLINTCTNCHNAHKPAFESRWPARLNTEKIRQTDNN